MSKISNEGDVKKAVKAIFAETEKRYPGKLWWFMPPANGYGRAGIPDFVGIFNGYGFAVETKFGKNELTVMQVREIAAVRQANGETWIVRETDIPTFRASFDAWVQLCS